jgi:uncharacterized membrane protein
MSKKILRLEIEYDLWVLLGLVLILLLTIYVYPLPVFRIILGSFCMLFVPGYSLLAALFPQRDDLRGSVRAPLSFGLSIPIVSLLGLVLHYAPMGIRLESVLVAAGLFVLVCSGVAFYRRSKLAPENRFSIRLQFDVSRWQAMEPLDKALSVALVLSILAIMGALAHGISKPKIGAKFTEFYILGPSGEATWYVEEAVAGEPITLIVGVANRENDEIQYRIERMGITDREPVATVQLDGGETWEQPYTFTLTQPGEKQKVEFLLYKGDDQEPCHSLHLWITVK